MALPPCSLQAALRREALAKKRREDKKLRRENEQPVNGSEGTAGQRDENNGPSTSAPTQGPPVVKMSRWETEAGEPEERGWREQGTTRTRVEQDVRQQSVMARTAHAEIAAFKKRFGAREDEKGIENGGGEKYSEGEVLAARIEGDELSRRLHADSRKTSAPKLDDLNDLEDLDEADNSEDGDRVIHGVRGDEEERRPVSAPMPGPARPDAQHVQRYDEVVEADADDADDADRQNDGNHTMNEDKRYIGVNERQGTGDTSVSAGDVLVSNTQRLFKRKMSLMQSCRDVDRYEKLNRISEGTYGVVYRGRDLETSTICALKRLKLDKEKAGFPLTSVREINVLLALEHPNIVNVSEVVMGRRHAYDPREDQIFMVMEYADHDLSSLKHRFSGSEVKCLMKQLLSGVAYLHDNYVMHRDLKPANILYNNKGQLKICDFGLARQFSSFTRDYTQMVVTLWYRAPELLLGTRQYSSAIDVWSVGCIMAQLLTGRALLNGQGELDQLRKTYDMLGYPEADGYLSTLPLWSKCSHIKRSAHALSLKEVLLRANVPVTDELLDLLNRLLDLDPKTRITAHDALDHPWFRCHPLPKDVALMPTFPSSTRF